MDRKTIENYFVENWSQLVSRESMDVLIELTCRAYKLNQPELPGFIKGEEPPKPQDLGKI